MKTTIAKINFLLLVTSCMVRAQTSGEMQSSHEKMAIFNSWTGKWKGEGRTQRGRDLSETSLVEENIAFKLGGRILVVEGRGTLPATGSAPEKVVHHAYGILHFDQTTNSYKFKSYLSDGKSTEAWFTVQGDNQFQWGFDVPGGKVRYTIVIDPVKKTWNEKGEFSRDDTTWFPMFEMNLNKV